MANPDASESSEDKDKDNKDKDNKDKKPGIHQILKEEKSELMSLKMTNEKYKYPWTYNRFLVLPHIINIISIK